MPLTRHIYGNSISDLRRYNWVVFEYRIDDQRWHGIDREGNWWELTEDKMLTLQWALAECNDRTYRCIMPDKLAYAHMIPMHLCE